MPRLGLLVLLAGIGVALFLYLPAPVGSLSSFDNLQPVATARDADATSDTMPAGRGTSGHARTSQNPIPVPSPAGPVTVEAPSTWQTTVSIEPPTAASVVPRTLSPNDPEARYKLVLEIQRQLKRVGCYWGRIDGLWGIATKDAMKNFTNRVNATLPLDAPDYVELALIQSQTDIACGACPAGQSLSASGRCVGPPITVQTEQTNAPKIAAEQKEVLPWKATPRSDAEGGQPLFKPVPTTGSTEPLPEHMAIGGPNPTPVDVQQNAPQVTPGAAPPATAATSVLDPNLPAVEPSTASNTDAHGRSGRSYHYRHFAGDAPPRGGRERLSLPRRNLLMSLGGLY